MELNNARIKHLCMTLQEWEGKNPTLKAGELCLVSDYPGLYKIGIEGKKWKEIPYPHAYDHNKSDISSSYLPLAGGTLAGDLQFASYGNSGERGIKAVMAANDYWGIVGRSTEDNQGILEIYTGDDGGSSTYNEIVKFSQYSGTRTTESTPVREFVVFDKSGNTSIPGTLSIGSTLTLRGNKGNANVFTDFNGGRGAVLRITDSSGVLHELGMWNNGIPNYIKGNTLYNLYHAGNLGIATSTKSGLVKSGGDISVGTDGTVLASGKALRITNGGVSVYYKFMSFDIGGDKGMIRFGIISPILGYGEFLISWGWQGTTEKHCYPYCLFSTNTQMYNRVKLVRTGDSTFDAYFESNSGNDYATFVFMGQSETSVKSFSASGVSSIPTVYKESAGIAAFLYGNLYIQKRYEEGDPVLKFLSPGHIEKWIRLNRTNNHLEITGNNGSLSELYASSFVGDLKGTADNADNANKLGNYGLFTSSSGSPAGHVPLIGADGVMEAGCYIDFHANGDTSDYNLRLMYDEGTDKKRWIKFPKASGTMALMNLIDSEDSAITIKSNCADFPAIDIIAGVPGNGMRITMSDAVDTGKLEFDGNLVWIDKQTDTSATLYVSDDVLYCNKDISSKGFYQSSDIRIKKNIREICRNDNRLEMAGDLSLKEFDMAGTERHAFGFIAQEVREKFPELVSEDKNGFLSLDYTSLLLLKIGFLEKKLSEVMSKLNNMDKRTNH